MSSLNPQGPYDLPSPEYDPLNPPFASRIEAASDILADTHAQLLTALNSQLAGPRTALAMPQIQLGGQVQDLLTAAQLPITAASQAAQGALEGQMALAMSQAAQTGLADMQPQAIAASIQGVPPWPPSLGAPDGSYQVLNWTGYKVVYGEPREMLGSDACGAIYKAVEDGHGGWIVTLQGGTPCPPLGGGGGLPGPHPTSCDQALQQQAIQLSIGQDIFLPLGCPCPAGYSSLPGNWSHDWGDGQGVVTVQICRLNVGAPPPIVVPPPPPPAPPPPAPPGQPCPPAVPCPTFKLWSGSECYIQPADQQPRDPGDTLLQEGRPSSGWITSIIQHCGVPCPQPEHPVEHLQPLPEESCLGDVAGHVWGEADLTQLVNDLFQLGQGGQAGGPQSLLGLVLKGLGIDTTTLGSALRLSVQTLLGPVKAILEAGVCGGVGSASINTTLFLMSILSKYLGELPPAAVRPLEQERDWRCPTELPTPSQASAAWLANAIDQDTWECWTRAGASKTGPAERIRHAARAKFPAGDLVALWRRGLLTDQELETRIRELGFTQNRDPNEAVALTMQYPTLQDIIRFMVRDAGDDQLAAQFGTDDGFQQKYSGQLQEYAKWGGVIDDYAKLAWRAHWDLPSPTQLYEMYHRLRHPWVPDNQRVTLDQIRDTLVADDKLPFWVDKYLAISFNPLGRIDARKLYKTGVFDEEKLRRAYLAMGYSDDDAQYLADYTVKAVREEWANSTLVSKMVSYKLSKSEGEERLTTAGATAQDISTVMSRVDLARETSRRQKCQQALRRRYFKYEFTTDDLRNKLLEDQAELAEAQQLSAAWACEREARGKVLPASAVCRLYERGLIPIEDLYTRFLAIGYTAADASLMAQDCAIRVGEKLDKAARDKMAKAQAIMEKNAKAAAGRLKQWERDLGDLNRKEQQRVAKANADADRLAKLRAGQVKLEEQRRNQIMKAAQTVSARGTDELAEVYHKMWAAVRDSVPIWWFDRTAATDAATVASKDPASLDYLNWQSVWQALSAEATAPLPEPLPPTLEVEAALSIQYAEFVPATTLPGEPAPDQSPAPDSAPPPTGSSPAPATARK